MRGTAAHAPHRFRSVVEVVLIAVLATACGSAADDGAQSGADGRVVVSAAASLTETFEQLASQFEAGHPGTEVVLNFGGSQTLAAQIVQGAPADVFASANEAQMAVVEEAGLVTDPAVFARNTLTIAVAQGNPLDVTDLADLTRPDLILVLTAPDVPAGAAAAEVLARADVGVTPASLEGDVRAALSKVDLGEADAALVYRTDLAAAAGVEAVDIPPADNVTVDYPIAVVSTGSNPGSGAAFLDFVTAANGRRVLGDAGFGLP